MSSVDILTISPNYIYGEFVGATTEILNFDLKG